MKRRLFTLVSTLSLILFLAAASAWVRSYWAFDHVQRTNRRMVDTILIERYSHFSSSRGGFSFGSLLVQTDQGRVEESWIKRYGGSGSTRWDHSLRAPGDLLPIGWGLWGFHLHREAVGGTNENGRRWSNEGWRVTVPWWAMAVLSAACPGIWIVRMLRVRRSLRRLRLGLCPTCGYDIRATPQRCPECGTMTNNSPSPLYSGEREG